MDGQQQDAFAFVDAFAFEFPVLVVVITPVFLLSVKPDDWPGTDVISKVAEIIFSQGSTDKCLQRMLVLVTM